MCLRQRDFFRSHNRKSPHVEHILTTAGSSDHVRRERGGADGGEHDRLPGLQGQRHGLRQSAHRISHGGSVVERINGLHSTSCSRIRLRFRVVGCDGQRSCCGSTHVNLSAILHPHSDAHPRAHRHSLGDAHCHAHCHSVGKAQCDSVCNSICHSECDAISRA